MRFIELHSNGERVMVNAAHIITLESAINLDGEKYTAVVTIDNFLPVSESIDEIMQKIRG